MERGDFEGTIGHWIGDALAVVGDRRAKFARQQGQGRTFKGAVVDVHVPFERHIRQQTDAHRSRQVEKAAEVT